jgi:hypothetical protein
VTAAEQALAQREAQLQQRCVAAAAAAAAAASLSPQLLPKLGRLCCPLLPCVLPVYCAWHVCLEEASRCSVLTPAAPPCVALRDTGGAACL